MRTVKSLSFVVTLLVVLAFTAPTAFAQASSSFRETPKEESRKLIEVPKEPALINIDLWLNKACGSPYYTGEKALIYFKTDVDGYITLYDIDTQGKVLVIFPNRHTPDNFVRAGQTLQIPAREASYDLIVEGPAGIEYVEGVASTDPYYHWNYHQGEPRWLEDWGLKGRKKQQIEAGNYDNQPVAALEKSSEYEEQPEGLGALGLKSLEKNYQISRSLREEVRSNLVVRPREEPATGGGKVEPVSQVENYSMASCYLYVVEGAPPQVQPTSTSTRTEYLRQQAQDFRQVPGLEVQTKEDRLIVEMPGRILFDTGSAALRYEAQQDLYTVADILLRYPDTNIVVMGHTDSRGEYNYNQRLSEQRARSVGDFLVYRGVQPFRISWIGYGESMPVASNETESGRQRNRRVELDIQVNDQFGR